MHTKFGYYWSTFKLPVTQCWHSWWFPALMCAHMNMRWWKAEPLSLAVWGKYISSDCKGFSEAKTWVQQSGRLDKKAGRENTQTLELSSTQNTVLDLAKWYKFVTACVGLLAGGYSSCEDSLALHSCNRKTFDFLTLSILVFLNQTQGVFLLKSQKFQNAITERLLKRTSEGQRRGDLIHSYKYLKGGGQEDGPSSSWWCQTTGQEAMSRNGCTGSSIWTWERNFLAVTVHSNRLPREDVESPSLKTPQNHLHTILCHVLWTTLLELGSRTRWSTVVHLNQVTHLNHSVTLLRQGRFCSFLAGSIFWSHRQHIIPNLSETVLHLKSYSFLLPLFQLEGYWKSWLL